MSAPISFFQTHPRVCALVLAGTQGSRLFPMTSADIPKHLLPVAGIPCLIRILQAIKSFPQVVVTIHAGDTATLPALQSVATESKSIQASNEGNQWMIRLKGDASKDVVLVQLGDDCFGPMDAVRHVEAARVIHPSTRLVVFPGDLVILQANLNLSSLLRPSLDSACTVLLVDVGEVDEHGMPLKESAKAKKGGLARDEEDIEYIGLSYPTTTAVSQETPAMPRIVLKQLKLDVEADEDMTGTTAKLQVPKARLRHGRLLVRTEWSDVHVYSLAPWVRHLIRTQKNLSSVQADLLPLLVSRQFKGKRSTFGSSLQEGEDTSSGEKEVEPELTIEIDEEPFSVLAHVLPSKAILRANTVSSYLYACKEAVAHGATLQMPQNSKWNGKFQTLVLEGSNLDKKINMKCSIVGSGCTMGTKCRVNNVVIMNNVIIGENCSLQNTVIGSGATLGNNVSLNDCQVGPGKEIPPGTKEKGESFMVGDAMEEDVL